MKWTISDESKCKKIVEIIVDKEKVKETYGKIFQKVKNNAKIDGYRKGKVPDDIIKTNYKNYIREEVIKEIIPSSYTEFLKNSGLKIVTDPEFQEVKYEQDDGDIIYKVKIEIAPEFELKDYKNIEIEKKELKEIKDEDVEKEINKLRQYRGNIKNVERDEIKEGDYVNVSIVGFIDNKADAELSTDNQILQIGAGTVLKDLEDGIKNMRLGEEKEITVKFPDDYFNKKFAGKSALLKVKVKEIKELELPELNDEFVKSLGRYNSVEELKNSIKDELKKQAEQDLRNFKIQEVIKKLLEDNQFEVPEKLINQELENIIIRYERELMQQGLKLEDIGMTRDELREKNRDQAEKNVRLIYILQKIAENENIKIDDKDVEEEIKKIAQETKENPDDVIRQVKARGNWEVLKSKLLEDKVLEFLIKDK